MQIFLCCLLIHLSIYSFLPISFFFIYFILSAFFFCRKSVPLFFLLCPSFFVFFFSFHFSCCVLFTFLRLLSCLQWGVGPLRVSTLMNLSSFVFSFHPSLFFGLVFCFRMFFFGDFIRVSFFLNLFNFSSYRYVYFWLLLSWVLYLDRHYCFCFLYVWFL